ncbi:hypothetical protein B0H17DRAFT_1136751 [Mycena rosella]|uniref:Uncharacterized protein n=1 Tax=Mycena rosella TaxID=1033263 RepID=A0AAD7DAJ3_MYCRO|nr:hypothetical protein B0H17DRAFT_1136751 [Mycena rosella]
MCKVKRAIPCKAVALSSNWDKGSYKLATNIDGVPKRVPRHRFVSRALRLKPRSLIPRTVPPTLNQRRDPRGDRCQFISILGALNMEAVLDEADRTSSLEATDLANCNGSFDPRRPNYDQASRFLTLELPNHSGRIIDELHPAPNTDIVLPPLAEVFAIMATASSHQPPGPSATPTLSATNIIHLGPGPVLLPTTDRIENSPTPSSPSSSSEAHREAPTLAHRFIFASVVVLSMITLILAIYAVSYHRHQLRLNRFNVAEERRVFPEEKEKGRSSVVHITRDFPRSKFSVTSSDYPISARDRSSSSTESDSSSEEDSDSDRESYGSERGLMDPAHFFALRASSMAASRRHSRGESAPVFGIPRFDARREQSRRSRSVSGPREEEWL